MRVVVVMLLCLLLTAGCQPFGGPRADAPTPAAGRTDRPLGAPDAAAPQTLAELLLRGQTIAQEWQDDPVLAEVHVAVDADGNWTQARLSYVAGDAERVLQLESAGAGFTEQRPSLATLNVQTVPGTALEEVPAFPDDAAEPQELAAAPAAAECGITDEATVLYASGAPYAWDGTAWASPPRWSVTVTTEQGAGANLDITTGAGGGCLD